MRSYAAHLLTAGTLGGIAVAAAMLATHGATVEGWQLATRYTARLSFFLFLAVYLVSPLSRVWRPAFVANAMRQRRGLGLAFAGAHFVHLAALLTFFQASGEAPEPAVVAAGGLGYVFIAAMAATSNDWSFRTLGPKRWHLLHRVGLHYVWLIFALTILGRVAEPANDPEPVAHLVMLALALAALAFRIGVFLVRRSPKTAQGGTP